MKIIITANEAIDLGIWEDVCRIKGINEWVVNEGMMNGTDEITLSEKEAVELHLYPQKMN